MAPSRQASIRSRRSQAPRASLSANPTVAAFARLRAATRFMVRAGAVGFASQEVSI